MPLPIKTPEDLGILARTFVPARNQHRRQADDLQELLDCQPRMFPDSAQGRLERQRVEERIATLRAMADQEQESR